MINSSYIRQNVEKNVCTITIDRREKHNAFNEVIIAELKMILKKIDTDANIQVVIINAEGKNFSAGADLDWMKRMARCSREANEADALTLGNLFQQLDRLSKPTIALVHGYVIGGGIGFVACCDIAIATIETQFCFSEVKLGLVPAIIAPYIIRSIGYGPARRYFLTAELFSAIEAKEMGLLHQVVKVNALQSIGYILAESIKKNGPQALLATKRLLNDLLPINENIISQTATFLSTIRTSNEARERINDFLKARKQ
ncbi:enoyl-CoA hydratase-related protein [Coxiella endosymbiont of Amblyomma nuttalli]|uniref:enoyl-CoA hydratase-related protein n=1 Tax=Coxiella endosymbiont of Amblyomma nuttalli TaxID=2749996 RepID=UPI001BA93A62|nr:enoyl-CoA hydratase-related protein [Coxiella endosymbiont of Amblyomma nuttalli]QTS84000.1 2,3-dehydroadipyl-CoA hydratase [Coxiella endosymbiont of Amblyomma nuttalli]